MDLETIKYIVLGTTMVISSGIIASISYNLYCMYLFDEVMLKYHKALRKNESLKLKEFVDSGNFGKFSDLEKRLVSSINDQRG